MSSGIPNSDELSRQVQEAFNASLDEIGKVAREQGRQLAHKCVSELVASFRKGVEEDIEDLFQAIEAFEASNRSK